MAISVNVESDPSSNDPELKQLWDETATATVDPRHTIKPRLPSAGALDLPKDQLKILGELGVGGTSRVMVAHQTVLAREVAVKELQKADAGGERWLRFLSEAVVTAGLEHPNIVPVHELRQSSGGGIQLVMKRVRGRTWRDLAADQRTNGSFDIDAHLDVLLRVCDALAFSHDRGILHLDIKPANVMVGSFGEVQLMDWGCAHAMSGDWPGLVPRLDHAGRTLHGSPAYMAPEQARGELGLFGPWTDVYLLATSLMEVVFDVTRRSEGGVRGALSAAGRGEVPWPRKGLDRRAGLGKILARALFADPAKRTQSVQDFAAAIRLYRTERQDRVLVRGALSELRKGGTGKENAARHFGNAVLLASQVEDSSPLRSEADVVHYEALVAHASWATDNQRADLALSLAEEASDLTDDCDHLSHRDAHEPILRRAKARHQRQLRAVRQSQRLRLIVASAACAAIAVLALTMGWMGQRALRKQAVHDRAELVQMLAAHVTTATELVDDYDDSQDHVLFDALEAARAWYGHPEQAGILSITVEGGRFGGAVVGERQVRNTVFSSAAAITDGLPEHVSCYPLMIPTASGEVSAWRFKSRIGEGEVAVWLDISAEDFQAASRRLWLVCLLGAAIAIAAVVGVVMGPFGLKQAAAVATKEREPTRRRRR